jgi:hypothetical protein
VLDQSSGLLEKVIEILLCVPSIVGKKSLKEKLETARAVKATKAAGETHPAALLKSPGTLILQKSL